MFTDEKPDIFAVDAKLNDWIIAIRRHIHCYPELSFKEHKTSLFVQEKLRELDVQFESGVAGTGVVASLPGPTGRTRGVALRADMDALPVCEETCLPFSSKHAGVMHACGHDGHTAMLLGASALLKTKELPGPVKLLFQPAEEHGNGAEKFIEAGVLEGVDEIFSGHIDTHFPLGTMTVDEDIICAWADPFRIRILGKSGHAARPHEAVDALVAAANLVMSAQTLISRGVNPNCAAVLTIGSMQAGTAQNIIAGEALLKGTIRSTHYQTRQRVIAGLKQLLTSIGEMHGVETSLVFDDAVPAVVNNSIAVENARIAATRTQGLLFLISQGAPSLGAEDFAFYQQKIPGCMVRFGGAAVAEAGVSHSGSYDFHEDVLKLGASWYANVAWQWLCRRYNENGEGL